MKKRMIIAFMLSINVIIIIIIIKSINNINIRLVLYRSAFETQRTPGCAPEIMMIILINNIIIIVVVIIIIVIIIVTTIIIAKTITTKPQTP